MKTRPVNSCGLNGQHKAGSGYSRDGTYFNQSINHFIRIWQPTAGLTYIIQTLPDYTYNQTYKCHWK